MELFVCIGDFGLVSINPESIRSVLYVKLSKAPVKIWYSRNLYFSLCNEYPVFQHGSIVISDYAEIVNYLRLDNYVIDSSLNRKQTSESYTLVNMIISSLRPVYEFIFWMDKKNYDELTSLWFSKVMPVPFNYVFIRKRRKIACAFLETLYPREDNMDIIERALYKKVNECVSCLMSRLGQNEYFYGSTPTSLDITVYAYIAPLLKIPFPSNRLSKFLKNWPEVMKFIKRFDQYIFPNITYNSKYLKRTVSISKIVRHAEEDVTTSVATKIFVSTLVLSIMFGYAASKNIIDFGKWWRFVIG